MLINNVNPNKKKIGEPVAQSKENTQTIVQRRGIIKRTRDMKINCFNPKVIRVL